MSATTGIQWTDATWNPVVGCTKVSQGCKNCYAKTLHDQRHKAHLAGKKVAPQYAQPFETVQLMPGRLDQPLHWRKQRRIFVNSVSDLFHEHIPDDFLLSVFDVMRRCTWAGGQNCGRISGDGHTFQILTKRAQRMRDFVRRLSWTGERLILADRDAPTSGVSAMMEQIWLGVSVENQAAACERIPLLLDTPAAVRFLSCEPLIGPVDLMPWLYDEFEATTMPDLDAPKPPSRGLSWVIVGGESGNHPRVLFLEWVRDILRDCAGAGVAPYVKQLGVMPFTRKSEFFGKGRSRDSLADGWYHELRDSHGGDPAEWPEDLRIREFPMEAALV